MLALGWTDAKLPPLKNITVCQHGPLSLLASASNLTVSPRDRMRQQLRVFESGTDLLPLAVQTPLTIEQAQSTPEDAILAALRRIAGKAQFTFELSPKHGRHQPQTTNGRAWLKARESQKAALGGLIASITDISTQIGATVGNVRQSTGKVGVDILIERTDTLGLLAQLKEMGHQHIPPNTRVTGVGPLPPYSFSTLEVH